MKLYNFLLEEESKDYIGSIIQRDKQLEQNDIRDENGRRKAKGLPLVSTELNKIEDKVNKISDNENIKGQIKQDILKAKTDAKRLEKSYLKRSITKFTADGRIYYKYLDNVNSINALSQVLSERLKKDSNPLIVVGDMSGMGDLNNKMGREIADRCVEYAMNLFSEKMGDMGFVASPSGDEMWLLPNEGVEEDEIVGRLEEYLRKINSPIGDEKLAELIAEKNNGKVFGLNAKFYVGREKFSDVENLLKYKDKEREIKYDPGTIIVDGEEVETEGISKEAQPNG